MKTQLLKRVHENKKKMRVGRGGKRGKTAGRGTKGQKARAGHKIRPEIRDLIKKLPKLRGRGKNSNQTIFGSNVALNLGALDKAFKAGETVTRALLIERNVVRMNADTKQPIKILAEGEITKKLSFTGLRMSAKAKEKIEKAGGSVTA